MQAVRLRQTRTQTAPLIHVYARANTLFHFPAHHMPSTGRPSSKILLSYCGASSAYTLLGPPEITIALMANREKASTNHGVHSNKEEHLVYTRRRLHFVSFPHQCQLLHLCTTLYMHAWTQLHHTYIHTHNTRNGRSTLNSLKPLLSQSFCSCFQRQNLCIHVQRSQLAIDDLAVLCARIQDGDQLGGRHDGRT